MKTYRVAVVGLGRMGSTIDISIANACDASDRLELVAGADTLPERRDAFKKTWGVDAIYDDYEEMISRESPDIVAVCTTATGLPKPGRKAPSRDYREDSHAEVTTTAAKAGVPMLYVEKAIACSARAADEILKACLENGTRINTGVLMRFDDRFTTVRDLIARGDIGEPTHAVAYTRSNTLMHMHIHSMDMLSYLLGDPGVTAVRGELLPRDLEIKDNRLDEDPNSTYQIRFANGVEAWAVPAGPRDFEIVGTEGSVRSMDQGLGAMLRGPESRDSSEPRRTKTLTPDTPSKMTTVVCLEDLLDAHESGRKTRGDVTVAHNLTEACLAVTESHRLGGAWVDLPMENRDLYVFHV
jgi:predicted dehydrogenase